MQDPAPRISHQVRRQRMKRHQPVADTDDPQRGDHQNDVGNQGRERGALDAEPWRPEQTEDQDRVKHHIFDPRGN